jgi:hypothetical protein
LKYTGQRVTVAHWLAESHDIRHEAVGLVAPEMSAGSRKAGLNLIGNKQSSGLVHDIGNSRQLAFGR